MATCSAQEYPTEKNDKNVNNLVKHKNSFVRREVAQHPEHAGKLVNDKNSSVQKIARLTLRNNDKSG